MAPNKAPGPDAIPTRVLKTLWPVIRLPLFAILSGAYSIRYFPRPWRQAISAILRKIGKPDYTKPGAYRPIALLCTLGKIFEAILARRISWLVEKYSLLPMAHFGCRPRRSTDDALISLAQTIHHNWRNGRVTACVQLDIRSAFTTVSRPRLIHNMRKRRIPIELTAVIDSFLSDRTSSIKCAGHLSAQSPLDVGIPQGSPLSGLLYLFYNSPLVDHPEDPVLYASVDRQGYADDITVIATAKTPREAREKLEASAAATNHWASTHGSTIDLAKTHFIVFNRNPAKEDRSPINFGGQTIQPAQSVTILGVEFDEKLRWTTHANKAAAKGHRTLLAISSLARTSWGLPLVHYRRLYLSCVVPRVDYGAIVWHPFGRGHTKNLHNINNVHNLALRGMLGGFRTSPIEALAHDTNLPHPAAPLDRTVAMAGARLLTLPNTNPAGKHARRAAHSDVSSFRSPLHKLYHSQILTSLYKHPIETILPVASPPWWTPDLTWLIAASKQAAIDGHNYAIQAPSANRTHFHLYSDGSNMDRGVGAAAVNPWTGEEELQSLERLHTVYEAELVGIALAINLCSKLPASAAHCTIHLDNQAAVSTPGRPAAAKSGQYLVLQIQDRVAALRKARPNLQLHLSWVPGHTDVHGNEEADDAAKRATRTTTTTNPVQLCTSLSATREAIAKVLKEAPCPTPKRSHHFFIRGSLKPPAALAMLAALPRGSCSILTQLRTGHIGLAAYLYRFRLVDSPDCITCGKREDIRHFLFSCARYDTARLRFFRQIQSLSLNPHSLIVLLSNPKAVKFTIAYVKNTRRFPLYTPAIPIPPRRQPTPPADTRT